MVSSEGGGGGGGGGGIFNYAAGCMDLLVDECMDQWTNAWTNQCVDQWTKCMDLLAPYQHDGDQGEVHFERLLLSHDEQTQQRGEERRGGADGLVEGHRDETQRHVAAHPPVRPLPLSVILFRCGCFFARLFFFFPSIRQLNSRCSRGIIEA